MKKVKILGIFVDKLTKKQALLEIEKLVLSGKKSYAVTVNPEFVLTAQEDEKFKKILNGADLRLCDGVGLIWASIVNRVLGRNQEVLNKTVPGIDMVEDLCYLASQKKWRLFFLGAEEGVAEKTAEVLKKKHKGLLVAGCFAGDGSSAGDKETTEAIRQAGRVDILFVAYGHQKQEKWIKRNLGKVSAGFAMGVGGAYDAISGKVKRTPKILDKIGLNWAWRGVVGPWRWGRIFRATVVFPIKLFTSRF
jgi:N-acetylglucosaminyldiphosphoundecaprenol N-acetyl-beta-D-mannosaminyltransferase